MIPPGQLYVTRGQPNPSGGASALYLLLGDATAAPIRAVVLAPGVTLPPPPCLSAEHPFRLTLLHFNDLHGRLADVTQGEIVPVFSRMAGYMRMARAPLGRRSLLRGLLVLGGGDDLVGSPFAELTGCTPAEFGCHPAYRVYLAGGVDAAVVGNHDLDWGLALLAHAARQDAAFPLLAANLTFGPGFCTDTHVARRATARQNVIPSLHSGQALSGLTTQGQLWQTPSEGSQRGRRDPFAALRAGSSLALSCHCGCAIDPLRVTIGTSSGAAKRRLGIYPAVLSVVNGLRVGVIGLVTPAEIKHVIPGEFAVTDPVQAVRHLLPALRPLCDVLIVLSHLGYSLDSTGAVTAGAGDVELARALPRGAVHLIIGGHTHNALNPAGLDASNIVNGIPIVQAGANGAYLGQVEIEVGPQGAAVTAARLHRVADLPVDADFEAMQVRPLAEPVRALLGQPIGRVADHPDLNTANVRAGFASQESALANFIADALAARSRAAGYPADFALVDASSLPAGLPLCDMLTFGDLFRLLPYADSIALCRITPAQLRDLLDDNARRADRPGEPYAERGFLQFSREVRYTVVLGPERRAAHATAITVDGVPLAQLLETRSEPFLVACSSFVRELAAAWERRGDVAGLGLVDLRACLAADTGRALRREILAFVREHGGVTAAAGVRRDGRVQFK